MELFIISGYAAICIALFAVLRIPLNKWTVPTASVGGIVLTFVLIQLLNYYHPYSNMSQQYLTVTPVTTDGAGQSTDLALMIEDRNVIAWFPENSLLRLKQGNDAEVTFDSVPGKVFAGLVKTVMPAADWDQDWAYESILNASEGEGQSRIPILIDITDRHYAWYVSQIPDGSHAQVAVYGREFQELALVRKTLLHMSAWMSYLSPLS
jgi:hypothetical protein